MARRASEEVEVEGVVQLLQRVAHAPTQPALFIAFLRLVTPSREIAKVFGLTGLRSPFRVTPLMVKAGT